MALLSPGVEVTIIDESFYESSTPGIVPLIVIATAENKSNPSGSGVAPMTARVNAGRLYQVDPLLYKEMIGRREVMLAMEGGKAPLNTRNARQ